MYFYNFNIMKRNNSCKPTNSKSNLNKNEGIYVFNPDINYSNKILNKTSHGVNFLVNKINKVEKKENNKMHSDYQTNEYQHQCEDNLVNNPYWIPGNNLGLFNLRDLKKKENEIKKMIKRNKSALQIDLDDVNRTNLKYKIEGLPFLKTVTNFKNYEAEENKKNSIIDNTALNTLVKMDLTKNRFDTDANKESFMIDTILKHKIDRIKAKENSITSFVDKTREMIKIKYAIKIKNEREQRLKETYENEIESIRDTIYSMLEAKSRFEKEFLVKFYSYVKYCINLKEKEKTEYNAENNKKYIIESKIKEKENAKLKLQEKIKKYEEYRNFLICIKEKVLMNSLNDILNKKDSEIYLTCLNNETTNLSKFSSNNSNLERIKNKKITQVFSHHLSKLNAINTVNDNYLTKSNNLSNKNLPKMINEENLLSKISEKQKRILNYIKFNFTIFNKSDELIEEIKNLEDENILNILKLNDLKAKLYDLENDIIKIKNGINNDNQNTEKSISVMQEIINNLKDKKTRLLNQKKILIFGDKLNINTNVKYSKFVKTLGSNIINNEKYNSLFNLNKYVETDDLQVFAKVIIKIKELYNKTQVISIFNDKKGITNKKDYLLMMKCIEQTLDFMIEKKRHYLDGGPDIEKKFKNILSNLQEKKKRRDNDKAKEQEKRKFEDLKIKIMKKNEKIFIRNKKEITKRYRPKEKVKKTIDEDKNNAAQTFEQLIHYSDDAF